MSLLHQLHFVLQGGRTVLEDISDDDQEADDTVDEDDDEEKKAGIHIFSKKLKILSSEIVTNFN